jgi:hypothetical protein
VLAPLSPVGFGPVLSDALARFFLGFPLKRKANGYSLRRSQISSPRARSRSMAMSQCRSHSSIWRTCRPAVSTFSAIMVARFGQLRALHGET